MLNQLAIATGLLLCATVNAQESKVCRLAEQSPEALKVVQENLNAYDSGNERINNLLKHFTATKVFQIKIGGDDYALVLATNPIKGWPGYNPVLVLLLNSELRPVACDLVGGEQVFEDAVFQKDKLELLTYSRARGGGTYTQKVRVSATGLAAEAATYSKDLDLGDFAGFTLSRPKEKEAEQVVTPNGP